MVIGRSNMVMTVLAIVAIMTVVAVMIGRHSNFNGSNGTFCVMAVTVIKPKYADEHPENKGEAGDGL